MSKPINFYSGPAILPEEVLQQAAEAVHNFAGTGLSILEISHRSKEFVNVMEGARALVKEILNLDARYEVLFLQGGALSQFHMAPMNLLNENETASYFDTGTWAHGALTEAKLFGHVHVACSSRDKNYTYIPQQFQVADNAAYLHITSNNTIYGTQLDLPLRGYNKGKTLLVADMSSDIFSRQLNFNDYDLIYASAQKNLGPAGTTLVIINRDILGRVQRPLPKMLDYRQHIAKESMLNTPTTMAVYVSYLTLQWLKKTGLQKIEEHNRIKAEKLYNAIDSSALFEGTVAKENRSLMNVCFVSKDKALEDPFAVYCTQNGIAGIKGHRSVGGFRASIYNAMPLSGVEKLIEVMREFERVKG